VNVYYEQQHVPLETIKYNAKAVAIIEPRSIWFIGGSWGVTWQAIQIKIEETGAERSEGSTRSDVLTEYAFIE